MCQKKKVIIIDDSALSAKPTESTFVLTNPYNLDGPQPIGNCKKGHNYLPVKHHDGNGIFKGCVKCSLCGYIPNNKLKT